MNDSYTWATDFRDLFDRGVDRYMRGSRDFSSWFSKDDVAFLASFGYKTHEFFDFVEDHCNEDGDEPSKETALLIAAARRDYFLVEQKGQRSSKTLTPETLPAKTAALEGVVWLPRIIAKAEAKLRGELDPDTMFGCGGDRAFLSEHDLNPADFLRVIWASQGDKKKIVHFVKTGKWA